jgi:hypothetical protein
VQDMHQTRVEVGLQYLTVLNLFIVLKTEHAKTTVQVLIFRCGRNLRDLMGCRVLKLYLLHFGRWSKRLVFVFERLLLEVLINFFLLVNFFLLINFFLYHIFKLK